MPDHRWRVLHGAFGMERSALSMRTPLRVYAGTRVSYRRFMGDAWSVMWVSLGSALGGAGRYWLSGVIATRVGESFPWGTLSVNLLGSAAIGLLAALSLPEGRFLISAPWRQFLMLGVLGGFTTFSSFSLQTLQLAQDGEWLRAGSYVLGSVLLCLAGVWVGFAAGAFFNR
jgi:CrcB protein